MTVSMDLAAVYDQDGFATGLDLFSPAEITHYRAAFDQLEAREGREKCQTGLINWHFQEEFIWQMATDPRLLDLIQQVMGEDVLLLATHFFCKYPDQEGKQFVAWHQDITYWGLEPSIAHTAWIAVDDSDIANGCMQVIPGTHRSGIAPHAKSARAGNLLSINQEIPDEHVDKSKVVHLELKAGQLSLHAGQVFHASHPNTSQRRRCGLTVRFIPPNARQVVLNSTGQQWQPLLMRGADHHHHYPDTPVPFPMPTR